MYNLNGRLFTFGCSITQYDWPTWADIAGTKWKKFENWGEAGAGNSFIFNSIIECDLQHHFDAQDTVAIMWTAPARHDNFSVNRWSHNIQIFNTDNPLAHSIDGYWLTTFSYIYAIDQMLTNRKIPYIMMSWMDYSSLDSKFHDLFHNTLNKIRHIPIPVQAKQIMKIANVDGLAKNLYDALHGPDWPSLQNIQDNKYSTTPEIQKEIDNFWQLLKNDPRVKISYSSHMDRHPLPTEHLKIAKQIFPNLQFDSDTETWVKNLDHELINGGYVFFEKFLPNKKYYELGENI
jgi:hypothetical protein